MENQINKEDLQMHLGWRVWLAEQVIESESYSNNLNEGGENGQFNR